MVSHCQLFNDYFCKFTSLTHFVDLAESNIHEFTAAAELSYDQAQDAKQMARRLIKTNGEDANLPGSLEAACNDAAMAFADWRIGDIYYLVSYHDQDLIVPEMKPVVFLGFEVGEEVTHAFFQDAESYFCWRKG